MIKKGLLLPFMAFAVSTALYAEKSTTLELTSPGGVHKVKFYGKTSASGANGLYYTVDFKDKSVLKESKAGLHVDNRVWEMALGKRTLQQPECWMDNMEIDSVSYSSHSGEWTPVYGERSLVKDNYTAGVVYMSKKDKSKYRLNVEVKAYDEGVAFRYFFPEHPDAIFHKVTDDLTEYSFADGTMAWSEQWAQGWFEHLDVNGLTNPVERALTLELPNGLWAALTDADVDDWCLTKYQASAEKRSTLKSVMYSPVDIVTYYATPWKIVMTAEKPGQLIEHNYIIENLNPACEIKDTSWIKPGKIMRSVEVTTQGGLATIDFCAEHNIPYMLYDWKWYEPCTSHDGDATKVVPHVDMKKVIEHGKEKGVGVWLYVNQHALQKQMRELFPLLKEWGVVGVKSGFVQYASHRWAVWLHDMVRLAAENKLMMNIHDEFRPSGFSRTYPNLLTQEGIHGNEEFPDATHNTILPFTRMINGAADYTICYYDKRLKNTHAHQLALSLIMYSPLQTIFWYDKPALYGGEPEIEWFENLKTVFDESRVLDGTPGKNITMARRSGEEWFVGMITNNDGSDEVLDLSFLDKDKTYLACVYTDGGEVVKTKTHVKCSYFLVNSSQDIKFGLNPKGGAAVRLYPVDKAAQKGYKKYNGRKL